MNQKVFIKCTEMCAVIFDPECWELLMSYLDGWYPGPLMFCCAYIWANPGHFSKYRLLSNVRVELAQIFHNHAISITRDYMEESKKKRMRHD